MKSFSVPSCLRAIPVLILLLVGLNCFAVNYTDNGSSTRYYLFPGDSLSIKTGTYTGTIELFNAGAFIYISSTAAFQPKDLKYASGTLVNYGQAYFDFNFSPNPNLQFLNYGTLHVTKNCILTTTNTWLNAFGALIEVDRLFQVNTSTFVNSGEIRASNMQVNSGSVFTNRNIINAATNFEVNGGSTFNNLGLIESKGTMSFNQGNYENNCQLSIEGNFSNSSTIINRSLIAIKDGYTFNNYGNLTLALNGALKATKFNNYQSISGTGNLYLTGETVNFGSIGTTGSTTDTIKVYDATRTNAPKFFDVDWGSVKSNVVFRTLLEPDPANYKAGCAAEFAGAVPLDVKWEAFTITDANGHPSLFWQAAYLANSTFLVERSYDNQSYTPVFTINARPDGQYNWIDESAAGLIVYYRIKAKESTGQISYSETKRFTLKVKGNEQAKVYPSPFSSTFQWSYIANNNANITFFIRSTGGQTLLQKTAKVTKGQNVVQFTELSSIPSGIYWLEVYNGNEQLSVHKLTKK